VDDNRIYDLAPDGNSEGESHGILDDLTEHRLSAAGLEEEEEEEEDERMFCVLSLKDFFGELTQNNDRFTAPGKAGSHVAKIKPGPGPL